MDTQQPDISIAPSQLQDVADLPQPGGSDDSSLLSNHVAVAGAYYALAERFHALVCSVTTQAGYTINGAKPVPPPWCARVDSPVERSPPVDEKNSKKVHQDP